MNQILHNFNAYGEQFVPYARAVLLQTTLVFLIVWTLDRLLRQKVIAQVRYLLWLCVLMKFCLPTQWAAPFSLAEQLGSLTEPVQQTSTPLKTAVTVWIGEDINPPEFSTNQTLPPLASTTPPTPNRPSLSLQGGLFLCWCIGVGGMAIMALTRRFQMAVRIHQATPVCPGVRICIRTALPCVIGLFRPIILLPHHLTAALGQDEIELILQHEQHHIRRKDLWVLAWQTVLQVLFFYHPILWITNRNISHLRELAVDEAMARSENTSVSNYCSLLVRMVEHSSCPHLLPAYPGMTGVPSQLHQRVYRLLQGAPIGSRWSKLIMGLLLPIAYILLPGGCVQTVKDTPPVQSSMVILPKEPTMRSHEATPTSSTFPYHIQSETRFFSIPKSEADLFLSEYKEHGASSWRQFNLTLLSAPRVTTLHDAPGKSSVTTEIISPMKITFERVGGQWHPVPSEFKTYEAGVSTEVSPRVLWDGDPTGKTPEDYVNSPIEVTVSTRISKQLGERLFKLKDLGLADDSLTSHEFHFNQTNQVLRFKHGETKILSASLYSSPYVGAAVREKEKWLSPQKDLPSDEVIILFMTVRFVDPRGYYIP